MAIALVVAAGAAGWTVHALMQGSQAQPGTASVPTSSAAVVRTDLSTTTQVSGTLGYAGSYQVVNQLQGTAITALPFLGKVVRRGQPLYEVDGIVVPLFYGTRPMWRSVQSGISPGPDIYEIDRNLIALGYTDYGTLTPSNEFTTATAAAIDQWQAAKGLPQTGSLQLGAVAIEPGPMRVASLVGAVGATAQSGLVILDATSTLRSVDVQLPVTEEYLVRKGADVTITLPNGTSTTPGVVTSIAPVASAPGSSGAVGGGAGGSSSGSNSGNSASATGSDTVDMSVRLTDPAEAGQFDQAPVEVSIVDSHVAGVLAVPINALVALAGGGYAVVLTGGGAQRILPVQTGLFSDTMVEVSGSGLRQGMRVEVPSQ